MTKEDYVDTVAQALTLLPPDTVIGRLTGDGMQSELLAPDWSRRKTAVINDIDKLMYEADIWQGKNYGECQRDIFCNKDIVIIHNGIAPVL